MDIQTLKQRYDIIGNDPRLMLALNKAVQVAPTNLSILITGESGVGKDVFSRIIHENSLRKHVRQGHGLISVNCGAIPEGTIESELFGHVKGAFTGADRSRKGYFEEADGGTIFLDEIGELLLAMQVMPVGSSTAQKIDVRVVAATNVDILKAVRNGRFREDLYYRLNQLSIYLPPLRERKDDIPLLFRKFSSAVAEKYHVPPIILTDEAKRMMMDYPWYGNVRELKNITEQIAVVETERTITPAILQNYLSYIPTERMPAVVEPGMQAGSAQSVTDRELLLKALSMGQMISEMRQEINDLRQMVGRMVQSNDTKQNMLPSTHYQLPTREEEEFVTPEIIEDDPVALEDRERNAIVRALEHSGGNRKMAANELHISERSLYRKIKLYGISE